MENHCTQVCNGQPRMACLARSMAASMPMSPSKSGSVLSLLQPALTSLGQTAKFRPPKHSVVEITTILVVEGLDVQKRIDGDMARMADRIGAELDAAWCQWAFRAVHAGRHYLTTSYEQFVCSDLARHESCLDEWHGHSFRVRSSGLSRLSPLILQ